MSEEKVEESKAKPLPRKMEKAARLLAEDVLTDVEIAAQCGVSDSALYKWKQREEFNARVTAMMEAYATRALAAGIASRVRRVEALNMLHDKIMRIMEERGRDRSMVDVPGASTGLIVRDFTLFRPATGPVVTVPVYYYDRSLSAEMRAIGEQMSKELGQWMPEVQQVNEVKIMVVYHTPDGKPVQYTEVAAAFPDQGIAKRSTPLMLPEGSPEPEVTLKYRDVEPNQ